MLKCVGFFIAMLCVWACDTWVSLRAILYISKLRAWLLCVHTHPHTGARHIHVLSCVRMVSRLIVDGLHVCIVKAHVWFENGWIRRDTHVFVYGFWYACCSTCHEEAALSSRDFHYVHVKVWRHYRKLSSHVRDSYELESRS